ncbi:regulator of G-protein signaling 17 isoform X1 [Oryzias latipes]|uniref:Regulator of G protein signaling 17 n=1 Tax=Oryzias sinensis TaxID=183150 RepID=A0A8C7WYC9_9TELE|nr:regulator of G-protein signaling 17 isoform X1 [Oryzias latipes]
MPCSVSGVEMRKRQAAHIEAPPQAPGQPRPNTCCLCWCGCCKCLWNEERMERNERQTCTMMDSIDAADEQRPSLEELLSWARSFDMMLRSFEGREIFREFLRSEYSEDNLLFWLACEELKKETNPSVVDEKARIIYEDYVSILSPKEVSLDSCVREGINQSLAEPSNVILQRPPGQQEAHLPRHLNLSVFRHRHRTPTKPLLKTFKFYNGARSWVWKISRCCD